MVETEYDRTVEMALRVSGGSVRCERFSRFRLQLDRRLSTIDKIGYQQVGAIRRFRNSAIDEDERQRYLEPLLSSMNCISAGLGWTG